MRWRKQPTEDRSGQTRSTLVLSEPSLTDERLEEEKKALSGDIKDVYGEAKRTAST